MLFSGASLQGVWAQTSESVFIENVLLQDALTQYKALPSDPLRRDKIVQAMSAIDTSLTPQAFQDAYALHIQAWASGNESEISRTFNDVRTITEQYGAHAPPTDIILLSMDLLYPGSAECIKTGLGEGNRVACGGQATECVTTGLGPGNRAACGGLATECVKTGLGEGNDAACGGLATTCVNTGLGAGNDVACGGLAAECVKTGLGEGNDAACGGLATECIKTGLGEANDAACGGQDLD